MKAKSLIAPTMACVLLSGVVCDTKAGLVGATVDVHAEDGFSSGGAICKTATVNNATVQAGAELVLSDYGGGCSGAAAVDIGDASVVLTTVQGGNYPWAEYLIHIDTGPAITGVSFTGFQGANPFFSSGAFSPVVTFDSDDIQIVWNTGSNSTQFVYNFALGGQAVFAVTTEAVPEPATLALVGLGLAGIGFSRRRKLN